MKKKIENYELKKLQKNLKPYIKMDINIKFDDTEIEEGKFHYYKNPTSVNDIHTYIYIYIYIYIFMILNISLITKIQN